LVAGFEDAALRAGYEGFEPQDLKEILSSFPLRRR